MILIKAILFDLDGTLLPLDTELFMQEYLKDFGNYIKKAINPQYFIKSLMASTSAMMADQNPQKTNYQIFWEDFQKHMGTQTNIVAPVMDAFYIEKFKDLVRMTSPNPKQATACVQAALQRGLKIVLATQPVFPLVAILERMRWAGIDTLPWDLITSYEKMHSCKPKASYYQEIACHLHVSPEQCMMVGNDMYDDLSAAKIGMKTYLVTDYLLVHGQNNIQADGRGSLQDFAPWLSAEILKQKELDCQT